MPALEPGELFAGYRIVGLIGSGGMGEVYLAEHPRLPRQDALKILSADVSGDEEYRQRFIREADLAAQLWHPHIVRINDRGDFNGNLWIAMDYVEGTDAAHLIVEQFPAGMPAEHVAIIVSAIASALDYAHDRGLLHRDVKPANILLTDPAAGERRILLSDFGIARRIGEASGLTATNFTVGTVLFSAPEQLMGHDIDGHADQYALAGTAFQLLTGITPFQNSNPIAVIGAHLNTPPPTLSQHRPDLAALDGVFAKALAKNPAERYDHCAQFATALSTRITGQTTTKHTTTGAAPISLPPDPNASTQTRIPDAPNPRTKARGTGFSGLESDSTEHGRGPRPRPRPSRILIAAAIMAGALGTIGITGYLVHSQRAAHSPPQTDLASPTPTAAASPTPPEPTTTPSPPPTTVDPTVRTPAAVHLPINHGSALVSTPSGKTACQIDTGDVGCQIMFTFTPPQVSDCPGIVVNGLTVSANGDWRWVCGDIGGGRTFTTLSYDTTYSALGWTITATSEGTTFTNMNRPGNAGGS